MIVKGRLVCLGELLAVLFDVGCGLDLFLGYRYSQLVGADLDPAEWHEGQVAGDEALLDGGELRLVGLNVDVDVLELADLLAVDVDEQLAVPLGDVLLGLFLMLGHGRGPSYARCR